MYYKHWCSVSRGRRASSHIVFMDLREYLCAYVPISWVRGWGREGRGNINFCGLLHAQSFPLSAYVMCLFSLHAWEATALPPHVLPPGISGISVFSHEWALCVTVSRRFCICEPKSPRKRLCRGLPPVYNIYDVLCDSCLRELGKYIINEAMLKWYKP